MKIYSETSLSAFQAWAGAVDTYYELEKFNKLDELEAILEDIYPDGISATELNDLLWFDSETVYDWAGLQYDEDTGEVSERSTA